MKKLFSLISVLLCAVMLSTTTFAASVDPLALYKKYQKNLANIKSLDISVSMKMDMTGLIGLDMMPEQMLTQDIAVKMRMPAGNDLEMELKSRNSETDEITYVYYKNGYMYQKKGNEKLKVRANRNDVFAASSVNYDLSLTDEMLKNAKFEMLEEGMKITYKTRIKDLPDNHFMSVLKYIEDDEFKFSSVTTRAIIGYDGMLKSGSNVVSMKISDDYVSADFKIVQAFKINSVNSVNVINFPSDLGNYRMNAW